MPVMHIFGDRDQLVPEAAASAVTTLANNARVEVLAECGHCPHITRPDEVASLIAGFCRNLHFPNQGANHLLKMQIATSFGRAASSYDAFAELQREVGESLLELIPSDLDPQAIADMGCGTGHFTARLADRYPQASCLGVDLAEGMIRFGASHHCHVTNLSWLCGDAENLAVDDGAFELIFSNFAFQWCEEPARLLAEQWRLLKPGGSLVFTTVGPETLRELRLAWQQVDNYVHVNRFAPLAELEIALKATGFQVDHWQEEIRIRHHPQLGALTRELKAIGAHNVNSGRNQGLTGRRHIEALKEAYEQFRTPEGLPATWQVLYVVARKEGAIGR